MPPPDLNKVQLIRDLKARGLNQLEIAEELGCTQTNVSYLSRTYRIVWDKGAAARDQRGERNPNFRGGLSRSTIERLTRSIMIREKRCLHTCERCGDFNEYQEQHRHHKDRNRSNNEPSNIEVLCTTCHNNEHTADRVRDHLGRFVS